MKKQLRWFAAWLVVATVMALAGLDRLVLRTSGEREAQLERESEAERARYWPLLQKDLALLEGHPFLRQSTRLRDAGPMLAGRVKWELDEKSEKSELVEGVRVPPELSEKLSAWGPHWLLHANEVDLSGVELDWFEELERYDHWNLYRSGPNARHDVLKGNPGDFLNPATPSVAHLRALAKLRLMQLHQRGELERGVREVEQLARLTMSANTFVMAHSGRAIARLLDDAAKSLECAGERPWWSPPLSDEELRALRRAVSARPAIDRDWPETEPEVPDALFCANVVEAAMIAVVLTGREGEGPSELEDRRLARCEPALLPVVHRYDSGVPAEQANTPLVLETEAGEHPMLTLWLNRLIRLSPGLRESAEARRIAMRGGGDPWKVYREESTVMPPPSAPCP